jgi:hypothetical protein
MSARPPKGPYVALGVLTLLTVGGPLAIAVILDGGAHRRWPPDRPVEWWTFGLVIGSFAIVMTVCLAIGLTNWRKTVALSRRGERERRGDRV